VVRAILALVPTSSGALPAGSTRGMLSEIPAGTLLGFSGGPVFVGTGNDLKVIGMVSGYWLELAEAIKDKPAIATDPSTVNATTGFIPVYDISITENLIKNPNQTSQAREEILAVSRMAKPGINRTEHSNNSMFGFTPERRKQRLASTLRPTMDGCLKTSSRPPSSFMV
jgi:hypothetical protein